MVIVQPVREVVQLFPEGMPAVLLGGTERPVVSLPPRQGPPGPRGETGDSAAQYVHTQSLAALTWVVNHDLGRFPLVGVYTPGGLEIEASHQHLSPNQTEIRFSAATSGYAVCQ